MRGARLIIHRITPRAAAPLLLFLVAHALLVSITHHHRRSDSSVNGSIAKLEGSTDGSGLGSESSGSDCFSCSLQRNFVSDSHSFSVSFKLLPDSVSHETIFADPPASRPGLITCDRAPPAHLA